MTAANLDCNEDGTISILDANCSAQLDNLLQDLNTVPGDLDGIDGVQFPDFLALSENFGLTPAVYIDGDIDQDGTVGFGDFLILSENFGQVAAAESVPEPSGIVLFGMLAVCVGVFRQSRP